MLFILKKHFRSSCPFMQPIISRASPVKTRIMHFNTSKRILDKVRVISHTTPRKLSLSAGTPPSMCWTLWAGQGGCQDLPTFPVHASAGRCGFAFWGMPPHLIHYIFAYLCISPLPPLPHPFRGAQLAPNPALSTLLPPTSARGNMPWYKPHKATSQH